PSLHAHQAARRPGPGIGSPVNVEPALARIACNGATLNLAQAWSEPGAMRARIYGYRAALRRPPKQPADLLGQGADTRPRTGPRQGRGAEGPYPPRRPRPPARGDAQGRGRRGPPRRPWPQGSRIRRRHRVPDRQAQAMIPIAKG